MKDNDLYSEKGLMALELYLALGGAKIVLVPFPLTPLAIFGYFLYRHLGALTSTHVIFYDWLSQSESPIPRRTNIDGVMRLFSFPFQHRLEFAERLTLQISSQATGGEKARLLKMFNFFSHHRHGPLEKEVTCPFCQAVAAGWQTPEILLPQMTVYLRRLLQEGQNPFKGLPPLEVYIPKKTAPPTPYPSSKFMDRPVFKSQIEKEHITGEPDPIIRYDRMELHEEMAAHLHEESLGIIVVGPPRSGKSTFVVSLANAMRNVLDSLATRHEWQGFTCPVRMIDLDRGTPTQDSIREFQGTSEYRKRHLAEKREWTSLAALEGLESFVMAKREPGIVVADTPGMITEYTEIVTFPADAGIVVTRDWNEIGKWNHFLKTVGVEPLAKVRSRESGAHESYLRSHHQRTVTGRVTGMEGLARSWDPFVGYLARILVFDLLPNIVKRRHRRTTEYYRIVA